MDRLFEELRGPEQDVSNSNALYDDRVDIRKHPEILGVVVGVLRIRESHCRSG